MRLTILIPLTALSCALSSRPPATEQPDPEPPAAPSQSIIQAMHKNLGGTTAMHDAVVRGDLAGARQAANAVATSPRIDQIPEPWLEYQVAMRLEAAKYREVESLPEAATGVVALLDRCAACHSFLALGPSFYASRPPVDKGDLASHMAVHAWAVDLMYKGLVAPDPKLYARGAVTLGEEETHVAKSASTDPEIVALAEAVHAIGAAAAGADTPEERAEGYAKVLGTCAQCHTKLDVNPTVPWSPTLKAPEDR